MINEYMKSSVGTFTCNSVQLGFDISDAGSDTLEDPNRTRGSLLRVGVESDGFVVLVGMYGLNDRIRHMLSKYINEEVVASARLTMFQFADFMKELNESDLLRLLYISPMYTQGPEDVLDSYMYIRHKNISLYEPSSDDE
jgi:hypothetical protein